MGPPPVSSTNCRCPSWAYLEPHSQRFVCASFLIARRFRSICESREPQPSLSSSWSPHGVHGVGHDVQKARLGAPALAADLCGGDRRSATPRDPVQIAHRLRPLDLGAAQKTKSGLRAWVWGRCFGSWASISTKAMGRGVRPDCQRTPVTRTPSPGMRSSAAYGERRSTVPWGGQSGVGVPRLCARASGGRSRRYAQPSPEGGGCDVWVNKFLHRGFRGDVIRCWRR